MMDIKAIQQALRQEGLDGWLFYDFQNRDSVAYRILGLDPRKHTSRRWFYYVPAQGEPRRLVHSVESTKLDALPGPKDVYLPWEQLHSLLKDILSGARRVAMQYSPQNAIPYISLVDAGTVELIRSFGAEVVSSADLVQQFEARLSPEAYATHLEASGLIHAIMESTMEEVRGRTRRGESFTECHIQSWILDRYREAGLTCEDMPPIVAVNAHAGDPHYDPTPEKTVPIRPGDLLLLDLWAKLDKPGAVYYDITWMAYLGEKAPPRMVEVFEAVRDARDHAIAFVEQRLQNHQEVAGWEVDQACRSSLEQKGLAKWFIHRTGHSIGEEVHGNGVHMDNLETKDERKLVPGILFSVEPGVYLPEFGVRSEVDVFIDQDKKVVVTGPKQSKLVLLD